MRYVMITIVFFLIIYTMEIEISFDPFRVYANKWMIVLGFALVGVGISLIIHQTSILERAKAFEEVIDVVNKMIDEEKSNN